MPSPISPRSLFLSLTIALGATACGGDGAPDAGREGGSGSRPAGAAADRTAGPVDSLDIGRATHLLPSEPVVDEADAARGLSVAAGDGVLFTEYRSRVSRPVDRHIKGFALVRDSFSSRFRDSRPSAVVRVVDGTEWRSPLLRVPKGATLHFSYLANLPGMGGYTNALQWRAHFEVPGEGGARASRVEVWGRDEFLRPPTGGSWKDVTVDLSALAGRAGRVVFSARVPATSTVPVPYDLVAVFGNPMIVPGADTRPNLLVISIDTLRREAISPYGGDPELTPNLQGLADRGVVLEQFWSTAPWTLPAYASLFTAEYPSTHGAGVDHEAPGDDAARAGGAHNGRVRSVADGIPSLVSHFKGQGYHTQAFYMNGHLNLKSGIERGFDGFVWFGSTGATGTEAFDEWAATIGDRPFFTIVQMVDPHWPYFVPTAYERKRDLQLPDTSKNASLVGKPTEMFVEGVPEEDREDMAVLYDVLVGYMDTRVGELLETLEDEGLADDTLVVFHVDHGEELWDHGEWWHGHTHHAELEHVPAIFSWPGRLPEGTRVREVFRAIDVLPTAIELLGLPAPTHDTEGESLVRLLRGEGGPAPIAVQESELYGQGGGYGIVEYPWRLIVQPMARWLDREAWKADPNAARQMDLVRLYDIAEDPRELNDLAAEHPDRVKQMRARAETILTRARGRKVGESEVTEMGADADANLEALGYFGDDPPPPDTDE